MCEAYEFCLSHRAPCSEKSASRPSEGGFGGIDKVFAAVGLGGGAQPPPARRGMLSQDLFESSNGALSRRSRANSPGGITPPPDALVREKSMAEGDKNAPLKNISYPFTGLGPRDSREQSGSHFRLLPEESAGSRDDDEEEVEVEGDIVVEVDDEGEEEEDEEEEYINPRSVRSHHRSLVVHTTHFRALVSPFPAVTRSHSVIRPRGQHVIRRLASHRLLACHCDTTKQEHVNSRIA